MFTIGLVHFIMREMKVLSPQGGAGRQEWAMIFIGGISQGSKILAYGKTLLCLFCQSRTGCEVIMTYYYFSFFFIPLFKWNRRYYVKTKCCGAVYELDPQVGKAVARGEEPEITDRDLRLVQEGTRRSGWQRQEWQGGYSEEEKEPDPSATVRCPVCRQECSAQFRYCPNCGQRLR